MRIAIFEGQFQAAVAKTAQHEVSLRSLKFKNFGISELLLLAKHIGFLLNMRKFGYYMRFALFSSPLEVLKMPYVVTDSCIKCKYTDCVEVCPVDCFYEGENMLVIHPDECIDCGVCEPECPAEAIVDDTHEKADKFLEMNRDYSEQWPNITRKKDAPADADKFKDEDGKFEKYFSPTPGEGD